MSDDDRDSRSSRKRRRHSSKRDSDRDRRDRDRDSRDDDREHRHKRHKSSRHKSSSRSHRSRRDDRDYDKDVKHEPKAKREPKVEDMFKNDDEEAPQEAPSIESKKAKLAAIRKKLADKNALLEKLRSKKQAAQAKTAAAAKAQASGPRPLLLDESGREIDEHGNVIQSRTTIVSTLKANQRKQKEVGRGDGQKKTRGRVYDPRMKMPAAERKKRSFNFIEPGKYVRISKRIRWFQQQVRRDSEGQSGEGKVKVSDTQTAIQIAMKRKAEMLAREIPAIEWWDRPFTKQGSYESGPDYTTLNSYVEHPIQLKPAADPGAPAPQPLKLTKAEQKKLRKRIRQEKQKEKYDRFLLGLDEAPEAKVKIKNMMRVYGSEAVQDPTQIEAKVRHEMMARQRRHDERNQARKLTPEERSAKKRRKMREDTSLKSKVAVYRIGKMHFDDPRKKFKVDKNAQQLNLSGCCLLCGTSDFAVVIVEGGPKGLRKYKGLMLRRIRWLERPDEDEDYPEGTETCSLAWEGEVLKAAFRSFAFYACDTELEARKYLEDRGVVQYFDMCKNHNV